MHFTTKPGSHTNSFSVVADFHEMYTRFKEHLTAMLTPHIWQSHSPEPWRQRLPFQSFQCDLSEPDVTVYALLLLRDEVLFCLKNNSCPVACPWLLRRWWWPASQTARAVTWHYTSDDSVDTIWVSEGGVLIFCLSLRNGVWCSRSFSSLPLIN